MARIESLKTITHTLGLRDFALNHFIEWLLLRGQSTCILFAIFSVRTIPNSITLSWTIYFVTPATWWHFFPLAPFSECHPTLQSVFFPFIWRKTCNTHRYQMNIAIEYCLCIPFIFEPNNMCALGMTYFGIRSICFSGCLFF